MRRFALLSIVTTLAFSLLPARSYAQMVPGVDRRQAGYWDQQAAKVRMEALEEVNKTLQAWRQAWSEDDARDLAKVYSETAAIMIPSTYAVVVGRDALETHYEALLPRLGNISISLSDFGASGKLAYAMGRYTYSPQQGDGSVVGGSFMMAFRRDNNDWKIQSQLFRPDRGVLSGSLASDAPQTEF